MGVFGTNVIRFAFSHLTIANFRYVFYVSVEGCRFSNLRRRATVGGVSSVNCGVTASVERGKKPPSPSLFASFPPSFRATCCRTAADRRPKGGRQGRVKRERESGEENGVHSPHQSLSSPLLMRARSLARLQPQSPQGRAGSKSLL